MGSAPKKQISDALKAMEQGAFQDFCAEFLPLFDNSYEGLERHGGTAEGKTRKGTPDLIKTLGDGRQIACQCSVEKNYWKPPKKREKIHEWKPCSDIDKCIEHLSDVREIVLCSNQEVPTNAPNAKADIISYARNKTNAKITLLNLADIEKVLSKNFDNPVFHRLFQIHLPEPYRQLEILREAQTSRLAIQLTKERPVRLDDLLTISGEAIKCFPNMQDARSYALKKIDELTSRFEIKQFPEPGHVKRVLPDDSPLLNPIGNVIALLGVPKIGKTSLIAQCVTKWEPNGASVHWFEAPIEVTEGNSLVEDISRSLWQCFLPSEKAAEVSAGIIRTHSIPIASLQYKLDQPTLYVLDNTELLSPETLRLICSLLSEIQSASLLMQIGFVFVSNKNLKHVCPVISQQITAPAWNQNELKELLCTSLSETDFLQDKGYMDLLEVMSGGHPLLALALSRKYSSKEELLVSNIKAPSLADEDLAAKVKTLLFEDMLPDVDFINLVIRLSPLVFKAKDKVIEAITKEMQPVIGKPFKLILEKVHGTVIEGDDKQGYSVSFVYKEVARKQLREKERQEILDVVSSALLRPEGRVINANEALDGIYYALLADVPERAFFWTSVLIESGIKKALSKDEMKYILNRLDFVLLFNPPDDPSVLVIYQTMLFSMAMYYIRISQEKEALKVLDRIKLPSKEIPDRKLRSHLEATSEAAKTFKMFCIARTDPAKAILILSRIDFSKIMDPPYAIPLPIADFSEALLTSLTIDEIPKNLLERIIKFNDPYHGSTLARLISIVLKITVKGQDDGLSAEKLSNFIPSNGLTSDLFSLVLNAQYELQKQNPKPALEFIQKAIALCQKEGLWFSSVENVLLQLQGDTYYILDERPNAKRCYLKCLETCAGKDDFDFGWPSYRLGLLSDDPAEANKYFEKSSTVFKTIGYDDVYARSEGERAVTFVELGKNEDFLRIAESLCRKYYIDEKDLFAPACAVILSQLTRLQFILKNEPIPEDKEKTLVEFERGCYAKALDEAHPRGGGITAFFILAKTYDLIGDIKKKVECLEIAISLQPINQVDLDGRPRALSDLLSERIYIADRDKVKDLIKQIIFTNLSEVTLSIQTLSFLAFYPLDKIISNLEDSPRSDFSVLLDEIESHLTDSGHENQGWFLADIYLRKAKLAEGSLDEQQEHALWKKAYQLGVEYENHEVVIQSAHFLYIKFYKFFNSLRSIAEIQLQQLKSLSVLKDFQRLEQVGSNLYDFWRSVGFRKLSEHDIKPKQSLLDGARILEKDGWNTNDASPLMILLLSAVYDYEGHSVDWARERLKGINLAVPETVKTKIAHFL